MASRRFFKLAAVCLFLAIVLSSQTAYADNRPPYNASEQEAYDLCQASKTGARRGAIWFSNNSSDYYASGVDVQYSDTSVSVDLRGSFYQCKDKEDYSMYATQIAPQGANASRLTGISTSWILYRGTATGGAYNWSSQGSSISATLDVSGLVDGATLSIDIYRCPSDASGTVLGVCYATSIPISIHRKPRPLQYTLTPTVNVSKQTVSEGQSTGVTYSVKNDQSEGDASNSTDWAVREVFIPAGTAIPAILNILGDSTAVLGQSGCERYTTSAPGIRCINLQNSSGLSFNKNTSTDITGTIGWGTLTLNAAEASKFGLPRFSPGAHVCRVLSVNSRDQTAPVQGTEFHNRDSAVACVHIANSPYVALVGGSAWAGGGIASPYNAPAGFRGVSNGSFGSFGEYGLFATSTVSNFGSGGQLWTGATPGSMGAGTQLTFANVSSFGSFSTTHTITDMVAHYTAGPVVGLGANGHVTASGFYTVSDVTLNSDGAPFAIPAGVHAVIYAPGKAVIVAGDLTYATSGVTSFDGVPSLVIVAANIKIKGAVQQVAGLFYASNSFVSCAEGPITAVNSGAITTSGACSKKLTVNGTITVGNQATNSLVFNRSYGGQAPGQPSEIIRMRPEVYLTPYEVTKNSSSIITTVLETELPARY